MRTPVPAEDDGVSAPASRDDPRHASGATEGGLSKVSRLAMSSVTNHSNKSFFSPVSADENETPAADRAVGPGSSRTGGDGDMAPERRDQPCPRIRPIPRARRPAPLFG